MKKTVLLLAILSLARLAVAQYPYNEAWLALGNSESDPHLREMQIDGKTLTVQGIDIGSDFPTDSLAMEEAFYWMRRHYFSAIRLLAPQPPLFHELNERYRFRLLDREQTEPFPWIWRPGMPDDRFLLHYFSPFGDAEIINIFCVECTKELTITLKRDFEWPDGAIALIYEVDPMGVEGEINGVIPLDQIQTGESVTVTLPVPSEWSVYNSYKWSIEVIEPFDGYRKGDFVLHHERSTVIN